MIEAKDKSEAIASWLEERKQVQEALKPFAELVSSTSGRIPVERLAFADWHKLYNVYKLINTTKGN